MSFPPESYRVVFNVKARITADVVATSAPDAHFTAFCELAQLLQNDGPVTDLLDAEQIAIDRIDPMALISCQPTNESPDQ